MFDHHRNSFSSRDRYHRFVATVSGSVYHRSKLEQLKRAGDDAATGGGQI